MKTLFFHSKPDSNKVRVTVAAIIDGAYATFGVARCSRKDQFVRKIGRDKALERVGTKPYLKIRVPNHENKWFVATAKGIAEVIKVNPELVSHE